MRKAVLSILLLTVSFVAIGQATFNRLEDYFGTNGQSSNFIQAELSFLNNYYFSLGIYDTLGVFYYCMIKADNQGNEIDRFVFQNPNGLISEYPNQTLISTSDSNIMICANLVDTLWDGYLIKLDTKLDTLWTKVYDLPANLAGCASGTNTINYFTAIKETPDKGFIIAGNFYKYCVNNSANKRGFLLKVDSLGTVIWWKTYQDITELYDIELTVGNGYVLINKWGGANIVKIDSVGNKIWQKPLNNLPGFGSVGDLSYCGNDTYIGVLYYVYDMSNILSGVRVFKININTQQILWEKTYHLYHDVHCLSLHQNMGVEVNSNGDIIVWATAHINPAPYVGAKRGAILKLNSQGDSLWAKYYGAPNITWDDELQLNDLIITDDGGFLGVGYQLDNAGRVMAWLFKTDANGTIGFQSPMFESSEFKVYPNPANDYIRIEFESQTKGALDLTIYNSVGKMVKNYRLSENQAQNRINISDMSGIYFCKITKNGELLGVQKLIILE